jgi:hypothetical protein
MKEEEFGQYSMHSITFFSQAPAEALLYIFIQF